MFARIFSALAVSTLVTTLAWPSAARACSAAACSNWTVQMRGNPPSNLPGFRFAAPNAEGVLDAGVRLVREDGGEHALSGDVGGGVAVLRLDGGLEPGASYEVIAERWCLPPDGDAGRSVIARFVAAAAAPLPSTAGDAVVGERRIGRAPPPTGSCAQPAERAELRTISLTLSPELAAWQSVAELSVEIAGVSPALYSVEPFVGGRFNDFLIVRDCGDDAGRSFDAGVHAVAIAARLPAGPQLRTEPVEVPFSCEEEASEPAPAGCGCSASASTALFPLLAVLFRLARRRTR